MGVGGGESEGWVSGGGESEGWVREGERVMGGCGRGRE